MGCSGSPPWAGPSPTPGQGTLLGFPSEEDTQVFSEGPNVCDASAGMQAAVAVCWVTHRQSLFQFPLAAVIAASPGEVPDKQGVPRCRAWPCGSVVSVLQ